MTWNMEVYSDNSRDLSALFTNRQGYPQRYHSLAILPLAEEGWNYYHQRFPRALRNDRSVQIKTANLKTHVCRSRCGAIGSFFQHLQERWGKIKEKARKRNKVLLLLRFIVGSIHIDRKTFDFITNKRRSTYKTSLYKTWGTHMNRRVIMVTMQLFLEKQLT